MVKNRLLLLKEFLIRPLVIVLALLTSLLGSYDTYFHRLPDWLKKSEIFNNILLLWSHNWGYIILIIIATAIFEGFYRKTSRYIGDVVEAKLNIEAFPRLDGYASVKVYNGEMEDLTEPELSYLNLYLIEGETRIPKLNEINPGNAVISWWLGGSEKDVIRGNNHSVFNLVKHESGVFKFLFDDGSAPEVQQGVYEAVLAIHGRMGIDNKKIQRVTKTCYIELCKNKIERVVESEDHIKEVKQAIYIDIRDTIEKTKDIQPSELLDLDMSS